MGDPVSVPRWAVVLFGALAAWTLWTVFLIPSMRWVLRRRVNRVLDELDTRLKIRVQPFKLTKRRVLVDRLSFDDEVQEEARRWAREEGVSEERALARVENYANEIVPSFNAYAYFRIGYWFSRKLARSLYRLRIGAVAEQAARELPPNTTVVFVINHRSNMDYVLVGYLAASSTALSYAVGEWARIWPLSTLIRAMGAYFVRRRSRDPLYRKVLERYVQMATESGVTQALFPEGRLSRDGALQEPRLGVLDYMLRTFDPGGERDIAFIPVGVNYDRTLEDRTLLLSEADSQGRGRFAAAWTFARFLGRNLKWMLALRWFRFGYACVNFGQPVSMKAELSARGLDLRGMGREERDAPVRELGELLMKKVGEVVPVLPVALVAEVFVRNPDRELGELEIQALLFERLRSLEEAGACVYVPRRDRVYTMGVGLRMLVLRRLVREEGGRYRAVEKEGPLLAYYANSIAHLGSSPESSS